MKYLKKLIDLRDQFLIEGGDSEMDTSIPLALNEYYNLFAGSEILMSGFNRFAPRGQLYHKNGYVYFCVERQNVLEWAIRQDDLKRENPPVYQLQPSNGEIYKDCSYLSTFLHVSACWQIVKWISTRMCPGRQ